MPIGNESDRDIIRSASGYSKARKYVNRIEAKISRSTLARFPNLANF